MEPILTNSSGALMANEASVKEARPALTKRFDGWRGCVENMPQGVGDHQRRTWREGALIQNCAFSMNWNWRGVPIPTGVVFKGDCITPKAESEMFPSGLANSALLKTLKTSARN